MSDLAPVHAYECASSIVKGRECSCGADPYAEGASDAEARIVAIIDDLAEKHPLCQETCRIILRRIDPALIPDAPRVDDRRAWLRWWN